MLVDMHVHTSRYSACGKSSPEEMVTQAELVGLGALVFTEHHIVWPQSELDELQTRFPRVRLFTGIEVETREGEDLLVYGVKNGTPFYRKMPALEVNEIARAHGGFVTLAHPFRYRSDIAPGMERYVDAVEVLSIHILNYGRNLAFKYAKNKHLLAAAASDAHSAFSLGLYALDISAAFTTEQELIALVQANRYALYSNQRRINEQNILARAAEEQVKQLISAGEEDGQIAQQVPGFTGHMVQSLRNKRDFLHPLK